MMQDSLDQCPMPINADQNSDIDPNGDEFQSGIDRYWEELIEVDRHWEAFRINTMILIGIGQYTFNIDLSS